MRTLALIPARAGSKGLPGKNRRIFNGAPLYEHALGIGQLTCDKAIVSTDDPEIEGAFVLRRPPELAQDDTPMLDVAMHACDHFPRFTSQGLDGVREYGFDVLAILQPTQPLRKPAHVKAALKLLEETGADSVVSVVQIPAHYSPDYALMNMGGRLRPFVGLGEYEYEPWPRLDEMPTRRQDAGPAYSRDGTVYAIRRKTIENGSLYGDNCVPLIIPSHESVNLDTEEDWQRAEAMVSR